MMFHSENAGKIKKEGSFLVFHQERVLEVTASSNSVSSVDCISNVVVSEVN